MMSRGQRYDIHRRLVLEQQMRWGEKIRLYTSSSALLSIIKITSEQKYIVKRMIICIDVPFEYLLAARRQHLHLLALYIARRQYLQRAL